MPSKRVDLPEPPAGPNALRGPDARPIQSRPGRNAAVQQAHVPAGDRGTALPPNLVDLRRAQNQQLVERLLALGLKREAARTAWSAAICRLRAEQIAADAMDVPDAYRQRLLALLPSDDDRPVSSAALHETIHARIAIDDACSRLSGLPLRCQARLLRELPAPRPTLVHSKVDSPLPATR